MIGSPWLTNPLPVRIQRKRTKGWKMPPNTIYVGRRSKWGNPFKLKNYKGYKKGDGTDYTLTDMVDIYKHMLTKGKWRWVGFEAREELRGKNLACWCPLDQPCHADVLLEIANRP